jgi:uncharacterized protein with PIN domain
MTPWYQGDKEFSSIQIRTKTHNRLIEDINEFNKQCIRSKEERHNEINKFRNSIVIVQCKLCESPLHKQSKKFMEIYKNVKVPVWVCPTCRSHYHGNIPRIIHNDKPNVHAEILTYDGIIG